MDLQTLSYLFVGATFALYLGIAFWARAGSTKEFYVAGGGIHPVANGMATAADWMSAASFISMAGMISFMGYGGSVFLMGWTGGYVILAMLLAPYLRKYGKFTVPEFIGDRFYSKTARVLDMNSQKQYLQNMPIRHTHRLPSFRNCLKLNRCMLRTPRLDQLLMSHSD